MSGANQINTNPCFAKALCQARFRTSELELDVINKRREMHAFASMVEKIGVKKSKVDQMRTEAGRWRRVLLTDKTHKALGAGRRLSGAGDDALCDLAEV